MGKVPKKEIDQRQDEVAAILEVYTKSVYHSMKPCRPKCVGCGLSDWIFAIKCPLCQHPGRTTACAGCAVRKRKGVCRYHHLGDSVPNGRLIADAKTAGSWAVELDSGTPPRETEETLNYARLVTPGSKRLKTAYDALYGSNSPELDADSLYIADQSPPNARRVIFQPRSTSTKSITIGSNALDTVIENQARIMERQNAIMEKLDQLLCGKNPDATSQPAGSPAIPAPCLSLDKYGISEKHLEKLLLYAGSRTAFSLKLVRLLFTKMELEGTNCSGACQKRQLDSGKLEDIKTIILSHMPPSGSETAESAWKQCIKAIDAMIRQTFRLQKLKDKLQLTNHASDDDASE